MSGSYSRISIGSGQGGSSGSGVTTLPFNKPKLTWASASTVSVYGPISSEDSSLVMNDGNLYTNSSAVTWDITSDLDTGSEATGTHYYLYAIPDGANWTVVGSVAAPTTGPSGESIWAYLGCVTNNTDGDILKFNQYGSNILYRNSVKIYANVNTDVEDDLLVLDSLAVTPPTTLTEIDCSDVIPVGASVGKFISAVDFDANTQGYFTVGLNSSDDYYVFMDTQNTASGAEARHYNNFDLPLESRSIWWRTDPGGGNGQDITETTDIFIAVQGYTDGFL